VLVLPKYLTLRPVFLVELCDALARETGRAVRIDWCRPMPSVATMLSDFAARLRASSINRQLQREGAERGWQASLQITASISRPGGVQRQLIIGWTGDTMPLPAWTIPIHLGSEPAMPDSLQSCPSS
jgi:hypothetical protein